MNRLEKFQSLCHHTFYAKDIKKLSEAQFDSIVEFIEDNSGLDNDSYTIKVNRLFSEGVRPKNHSTICDLLLASRV